MIRWFLHRKIRNFEKELNYDATYLHHIVDVGGLSLIWPLLMLQQLGSLRRSTPLDAYFAASLVAARKGDCGPCLQLVTRMAEQQKVPPGQLQAVLTGNPQAMSPDVALAYRFALLTLRREDNSELRQEIERRWGARAVVELGYVVATAGVYPLLKASLGHAEFCFPVEVGGQRLAPAPV